MKTNAANREDSHGEGKLVARWVEEPASSSRSTEGRVVTRGKLALHWFVEPEIELVHATPAGAKMKRAG